jgi:hypothetical protein
MAIITLCSHENCTIILSTTHTKHYDQTMNSSSVVHPHFWQLHTSIFNFTLFEPEINNGHTTLPAMYDAQMTPTVPLLAHCWRAFPKRSRLTRVSLRYILRHASWGRDLPASFPYPKHSSSPLTNVRNGFKSFLSLHILLLFTQWRFYISPHHRHLSVRRHVTYSCLSPRDSGISLHRYAIPLPIIFFIVNIFRLGKFWAIFL